MPETVGGRVFLFTAPDMTLEPDATEVADWLAKHRHVTVFTVEDVLEACEECLKARRGPQIQYPAVLLPPDGVWRTGVKVEVQLKEG